MNTADFSLAVGDWFESSSADETPATAAEIGDCLNAAKRLRGIWAAQGKDCETLDLLIENVRTDFYAAANGKEIRGIPLVLLLPLIAEVNAYVKAKE